METKICNKCKKEYPATTQYFYKRKDAKINLRSNCKKCNYKGNKIWNESNKDKVYVSYQKALKKKRNLFNIRIKPYFRKCSCCNNIFVLNNDNFHKTKAYSWGFRYECKTCSALKSKNRYIEDPNVKVMANKRRKVFASKNREHVNAMARKWRLNNKDKVKEQNAKMINIMSDGYIADLIGAGVKDTDKELIELKKEILKISRLIKQKTN